MSPAAVGFRSVAVKCLRSHAQVQGGNRERERGWGFVVDWRLHGLLCSHRLLLTASETKQHMRCSSARGGWGEGGGGVCGVISLLRQNPVYLPNNLICPTQPELKMRYTGYYYNYSGSLTVAKRERLEEEAADDAVLKI